MEKEKDNSFKFFLYIIVSIVVAFVFCWVFILNRTTVVQNFDFGFLNTYAYYKGYLINNESDFILLDTNDSIKIIRYREAEEWIEKFRKIDSMK